MVGHYAISIPYWACNLDGIDEVLIFEQIKNDNYFKKIVKRHEVFGRV